MRREELLREILRCSGKAYISDLSKGISERSIKEALRFISESGVEYEFSEWKDAMDYVTGGTAVLEDMDAVQNYIKKL